MGREKDPFQKRWHSQDGRRREHDDEYELVYEDEYELYEDAEDDEYAVEDMFDERGSNIPRRRSASPLPPFPSTTRNIYPRRSRASRMPRSMQPPALPPKRPGQTTHSKRQTYLPDDARPSSRYSAGSPQRPSQQTPRVRNDDVPRRPVSAGPVSSRPHKRRVWPIFLTGCAAGAVSLVLAIFVLALMGIHSAQNSLNIPGLPNQGKAIAGPPDTQTIPLSALSQLIVCDAAGTISLSIDPDPNASSATITTRKTALHAADQNDAERTFRQISVEAQPSSQTQKSPCQKSQATNTPTNNTSNSNTTPTPAVTNTTVLSVKVIFAPDQAGKMATVDVTILLPKSVVPLQDPTNPLVSTLITMQDSQGSINIDGMSGIMDIRDAFGDITVKNGTLVDGSHLETQGKLTFNGFIWPAALPPNTRAGLFFGGESLVDLTLPEDTRVILDATANVHTAKITSDFPINVETNSDGSSTYRGPFNPAIATDSNKVPHLTLIATLGNISLHKR
jgi:hypothetical protein